MALAFGTDGVRGRANSELTPEAVLALGPAAAGCSAPAPGRPARFVVGARHPTFGPAARGRPGGRASPARASTSISLGVAPTPAVAWVAAAEGVPAAVHLGVAQPVGRQRHQGAGLRAAASSRRGRGADHRAGVGPHPPRPHHRPAGGDRSHRRRPRGASTATSTPSWHPRRAHALRALGRRRLRQRRGVGAPPVPPCPARRHRHGHRRRSRTGATSTRTAGPPTPNACRRRWWRPGADVGLALDGDADRVLAVDGDGVAGGRRPPHRPLRHRPPRSGRAAGRHRGGHGHEQPRPPAARSRRDGITVVETHGRRPPRGRGARVEAGGALGGEQSGHVVFLDLATTGDGLLTGLQLLDVVRRAGRPLAELAATAMTPLPQVAAQRLGRSARHGRPSGRVETVARRGAPRDLGDDGRVLVRGPAAPSRWSG